MKYPSILLVAATALLISVEATIPDYIKTCKRTDPQIDNCIESSINSLELAEGIPELGVPSIKRLHFDKVHIELGPGLKAELRDLELRGLETFTLYNISVDIPKDVYSFRIAIPAVTITGLYDLDAAIAGIPLTGTGPVYFAPKTITGEGALYGKKVEKDGKTLFYFPKMKLNLHVEDYVMRLDNIANGDKTIGEVTNKLLNEQKTEVLAGILPGIEKVVIEKALLVANNVCQHFDYDELFPES